MDALAELPLWLFAVSAICAGHCLWSLWDALWKGYVARKRLEE